MGISITEVNFRRLLTAAPQQQNQTKLAHYLATLREQLEQLGGERTPQGLPRLAKGTINDYSEKIEAIAAKLVTPLQDIQEIQESSATISSPGDSPEGEEDRIPPSPRLRRRSVPNSHFDERTNKTPVEDTSEPVRLEATTQAHIAKHRKIQKDLTDDMVGLARQLKESSRTMNHSIQNTGKILDSTERAVEQSLASTGQIKVRTGEMYSRGSKTSCLQ